MMEARALEKGGQNKAEVKGVNGDGGVRNKLGGLNLDIRRHPRKKENTKKQEIKRKSSILQPGLAAKSGVGKARTAAIKGQTGILSHCSVKALMDIQDYRDG